MFHVSVGRAVLTASRLCLELGLHPPGNAVLASPNLLSIGPSIKKDARSLLAVLVSQTTSLEINLKLRFYSKFLFYLCPFFSPQCLAVNIRCLLTVHKVDAGTVFLQLIDIHQVQHTLCSLYIGMVYLKQAHGSDWQQLSDKMMYLYFLN